MIPVVADADTLFGATTRGVLIHLDYHGLIRLHWSPLILDELSRALVDTGRKPDAESARRHEQLMRAALPQAEIPTQRVQVQFASVAPALRSAKDAHIAACASAILAGDFYPDTRVVSLVTKNIRDFGVRKLATLGIEVQRPDAFLLDRFQRDPAAVASAFAALRSTLRSAPAPDRLLERLAADGQALTAAALHEAWQQGAVRLRRQGRSDASLGIPRSLPPRCVRLEGLQARDRAHPRSPRGNPCGRPTRPGNSRRRRRPLPGKALPGPEPGRQLLRRPRAARLMPCWKPATISTWSAEKTMLLAGPSELAMSWRKSGRPAGSPYSVMRSAAPPRQSVTMRRQIFSGKARGAVRPNTKSMSICRGVGRCRPEGPRIPHGSARSSAR